MVRLLSQSLTASLQRSAGGEGRAIHKGGLCPRAIGRTKGSLNSKLHMVSDGRGRPLNFFLSPGQMSDSTGARVLLAELPRAKRLLDDKGYDADWLRDELKSRGLRV
jgi:IS5 family transposase